MLVNEHGGSVAVNLPASPVIGRGAIAILWGACRLVLSNEGPVKVVAVARVKRWGISNSTVVPHDVGSSFLRFRVSRAEVSQARRASSHN